MPVRRTPRVTNPTTDESRPDTNKEYTLHNYQPYNSAVDQVVQQHVLVTESLRANNRESLLRQALMLTVAIALACLVAAVIYWLLFAAPTSKVGRDETPAPAEEFQAISDNNPPSAAGSFQSFVHFTRAYSSSGEVVVTAKEYEADDLESPAYQWCYITPSTSATNAPRIDLATIGDDGSIQVQTTDDRLLGEPLELCKFNSD